MTGSPAPPKSTIRNLIVTALLIAPACPGLAGEYPFQGYYTYSFSDINLKEVQDRCTLIFYRLRNDGTYSSYLLDIDRFLERKEITYALVGSGACSYDAARRIEKCINSSNYEVQGQAPTPFTSFLYHIDSSPIKIVGAAFYDEKLFDQFIQSPNIEGTWQSADGSTPTFLHRCPEINEQSVSHYLVEGKNAISPSKYEKFVLMIEDTQSGIAEIAKKVRDQIGRGQ